MGRQPGRNRCGFDGRVDHLTKLVSSPVVWQAWCVNSIEQAGVVTAAKPFRPCKGLCHAVEYKDNETGIRDPHEPLFALLALAAGRSPAWAEDLPERRAHARRARSAS